MDRLGDPHGVAGPVEEVRVGEAHVPRAQRHELGHVAHDDLLRHDAETPVVDDRATGSAATMRAAVARLNGPGKPLLVADDEPGVALQRRQEIARRRREPAAAKVHHDVTGVAVGRRLACSPLAHASSAGSYSPTITRSAKPAVSRVVPHACVEAVEADRMSGRRARTEAARATAIRIAVCIGTEKATPRPSPRAPVPSLRQTRRWRARRDRRRGEPRPARPRAPVGARARRWRPAGHARWHAIAARPVGSASDRPAEQAP